MMDPRMELDNFGNRLRTVEEIIAVHKSLCIEHVTFRDNISEIQGDVAHIKGNLHGKYITIVTIMSVLNLVLVGILVYTTIANKGGI